MLNILTKSLESNRGFGFYTLFNMNPETIKSLEKENVKLRNQIAKNEEKIYKNLSDLERQRISLNLSFLTKEDAQIKVNQCIDKYIAKEVIWPDFLKKNVIDAVSNLLISEVKQSLKQSYKP